MKNYFKTREEAEVYKAKHNLFQRSPEYIAYLDRWALVFPLKCSTQKPFN